MIDYSDEKYDRLQHAISLSRELLALAVELEDDLSVFQLKSVLNGFYHISQMAAHGRPDRGVIELKVHERDGSYITFVTPRHRPVDPDRFLDLP